jgi:arylformamidase
MRVIDLAFGFSEVRIPGRQVEDRDVIVRRIKTLDNDGISTMEFRLPGHVGTHIDAPAHLINGGATIDEIDISRCYGTAVCLDMRRGDDEGITTADLEKASPEIARSDIVLLETGWSDRLGTPDYMEHHPYLAVSAAEWLVDRGVAMVGIDTSGLDLPHSLRGPDFRHETLRVLLSGGVPALHGLRSLDAIRGKRCLVSAVPIVFVGADSGPVRAIAITE